MQEHRCPVCRKGFAPCGHLISNPDQIRADALEHLRQHAKTPLDLGVARFAADVFWLLSHSEKAR